ncbi:MAG: hypothetical protein ACK559_21570, partial [bacterium]
LGEHGGGVARRGGGHAEIVEEPPTGQHVAEHDGRAGARGDQPRVRRRRPRGLGAGEGEEQPAAGERHALPLSDQQAEDAVVELPVRREDRGLAVQAGLVEHALLVAEGAEALDAVVRAHAARSDAAEREI